MMMMLSNNEDAEVENKDKVVDDGAPRLIKVCEHPRIYRIANFLSDKECDYLIDISKQKLRPCNEISSGVHRSGWGVFLKEGEEDHPTTQNILNRMKTFVNMNMSCEVMQVIRYNPGEETSAHFDYFNPMTANGAMKIGLYGQRMCTILMYLTEVEEGGETSFPEAKVKVRPIKGDAVLFYNCKPNGEVDPMSLHQGDPVIKGTKWIAIKLVNNKNIGQPQQPLQQPHTPIDSSATAPNSTNSP
ncbi:hypothetical protein SAMD00019534_099340, partial [Acytostelium subglobosum LB1]|uniref:hypothetical protein n=1 Tax=Acytostelium subglobosum LB1 TaxID=1410327 RepID=UPI0006451794